MFRFCRLLKSQFIGYRQDASRPFFFERIANTGVEMGIMGQSIQCRGMVNWYPGMSRAHAMFPDSYPGLAVSRINCGNVHPCSYSKARILPKLANYVELNRISSRTFASTSSSILQEKQEKDKLEETVAAEESISILLSVQGMKCGGCSAAVKKILLKQPNVVGAAVNLLTETAVLQVSSTVEDPQHQAELAATAVTNKGFPTSLRSKSAEDETFGGGLNLMKKRQQELRESQWNLAFAWILASTCYGHHLGHLFHMLGWHGIAHSSLMEILGNPLVSGILGAAALLGPGRTLIKDGILSLVRGVPNMNSLIALGATTSFSAGTLSALIPGLQIDSSFLEEPVMLLAFVLLGRALETRARAKATTDLTALAQLIPDTSRLVMNEDATNQEEARCEMIVPTSTICSGDLLRVLPGERIPTDGIIVSGMGSVDESMMTGESRLIFKKVGDEVIGGTISYEAPIILRATRTGSSSTLSSIGRLVAVAQSREAPVQRLADKVAGWFCYGVMGTSAATFTFWNLIGTSWFPQVLNSMNAVSGHSASLLSMKLAIDVLVVACPCALGLATPTAVLVASSAGAKRGLLVRGGDVLEKMANVDTIVFDKTGTLTEGHLKVSNVCTMNGCSDTELLQIAHAVESTTTHPIALAIRKIAEEKGIDTINASSSLTIPGQGVSAVIKSEKVFVGKKDWIIEKVGKIESGGKDTSENATSVWVGTSKRGLLGRLEFSDELRTEATDVVSDLHRRGYRTVLLSGDKSSVVHSLAERAGISRNDAFGDITPAGKAKFVSDLRATGHVVTMVGDGVNDAVALSSADVGMAMGSGTDAAGEASDVVLMGDRLGQVVEAVDLGKATLNKIKQNLFLAVGYNAVSIPIAAGILLPKFDIALTPSFAAGMMACSSIIVVTNSLFLRVKK